MASESTPEPINCALFIARARRDDGTIDTTYHLALRTDVTNAIINQTSSCVPHYDDTVDWSPEDFFTAGFLFNFKKNEFWEDQGEIVSVGRFSRHIFFSVTKEFPERIINAGTHVISFVYVSSYNIEIE